MVAVIVDYGNTADFSGPGEAAFDPLEVGQSTCNHRFVDLHFQPDRDRRQCVEHVVASIHREPQAFDRALGVVARDDDVEAAAVGAAFGIDRPDFRLRAEAVGN